ncbi:MAG: cytochrome c3 family protein [Thermodesulfobacteriota bacterium]
MRPLFFSMIIIALVVSAGRAIAQTGCVTDQCHAGFTENKQTHPAEAQCLACHIDSEDKHAKGGAPPPPALQEDMCVSCHDGVLGRRHMHSPVTRSGCHLCHDPHGDMARKLLPAGYSDKPFINYDAEAYKFCFSCHKRDLLMFPDTSYSTRFRNGTSNLHYLHVNKANRGRSCKLCHETHGAEQPKMMADRVSFGNWRMPVNFRMTENGGSCSPGCHATRQYDRQARPAQPVPVPTASPDTEKNK